MATTPDAMTLRALLHLDRQTDRPPTVYTEAARYLTSLDGFNIKRPSIPAHVFLPERDRALHADAPTGLVPLDLGPLLGLDFPATTPLILARYARIRPGETLRTAFRASAELHYAIEGAGTTALGEGSRAEIEWEAGDAFCLPGGGPVVHRAGPRGARLWVVTNEPQLAFEALEPPTPERAPVRAAHYPGRTIRQRLLATHLDPRGPSMPGKSVNFGNAAREESRTTTPSFTLAMNSLLPGEVQRAHRHNAVAVTLVVAGERCYSLIEGQRVEWEPNAVMITPPTELHSHHNEGRELALFLIVQDGGLYYHCRTMGLSYR